MSSATGIRLLYCEMERPGNLPSYPPKQHYGLCIHKGKHSGLDVARLSKVRVPCRATRGRVEKSVTGPTVMKNTTILSQGHAKQLQLRSKFRLGTWNIHSMLELGKVQLLGEKMMRLGVDIIHQLPIASSFHYVGCQR